MMGFENSSTAAVNALPGLIIDNFAGGGGASTGIERGLGRPVDIAINHDPEAIAMHIANHPGTKHYCQSIMAIDPRDACTVEGKLRKVGFAWFSPDCKHHSKAKGGKPREKNIRDLAWVVVHWPERLGDNKPDIIMLENVEEFRKWGPLDEKGMPIREREGEEFDLWVRRIKRCGYKVEWRELRACDYGAPTSRKRLYLIARSDGQPIVWPEPTHGAPDSEEVLSGKRKPWRTAAECIDWSIPCPSIFDRDRPLKPNTLRRIAHGTMRYVVNAASPFIVPVTNSGWNPDRTWSADEPLRTVTTAKGGEYAAVDAGLVPLTHHGSPDRGQGTDTPFPTVTGANRGEMAHVEAQIVPHITKFRGGAIGSDAGEPMPTVTANGNPARPAGAQPLALASATLVQTGYGERNGQTPRSLDIQKPLGTVVAGGAKHAIAAVHMEKFNENSRGRPVDSPLDAVMSGAPRHAKVATLLSQFRGSNKTGSGGNPGEPAKAITAGGLHQAVVAAHLEQANGGPNNVNLTGRSADRPMSTVTATGSQQRLVETTLIEESDLPPELMVKATRTAAFLIKYYGTEAEGHGLTKPMGTATTLARFAVVTVEIEAVTYVIVDIGMRMLTPRELANAQGLPADYELAPVIEKTFANGRKKTRPLTKSEQIRMIGNMVCPDVAEALAGANPPNAEAERKAA